MGAPFRANALRPTPSRTTPLRAAAASAAVLAVLTLATSCGNDLEAAITSTSTPKTTAEQVTTTEQPTTTEPSSTSTSTTRKPTTSSTSTTVETTTTPAPTTTAPRSPRDWDGIKWDFGQIMSVTAGPDATIAFDRFTLSDENGDISADAYESEPVIFGNTDVPYLNQNTETRDYTLAEGVEILYLANSFLAGGCEMDGSDVPAPDWSPMTLEELANADAVVLGTQTSLTFSDAGFVERIRLSYSC